MRFSYQRGVLSVSTVLYMLLGGVLLFFPSLTIRAFSTVIGTLCFLFGIGGLLRALSRPTGMSVTGIIFGFAGILFGSHFFRNPGSVLSLLPFIAGIFFIYNGVSRIRTALNHASGSGDFFTRLGVQGIFGSVLTLAGLWLILFPMNAVGWTLRIIGILILIDALGDIYPSLFKSMKGGEDEGHFIHRAPDGKYEAEFRDISDKE